MFKAQLVTKLLFVGTALGSLAAFFSVLSPLWLAQGFQNAMNGTPSASNPLDGVITIGFYAIPYLLSMGGVAAVLLSFRLQKRNDVLFLRIWGVVLLLMAIFILKLP